MTATMLAFWVGVMVGVLGGIFLIGILSLAKEENRAGEMLILRETDAADH